MFWKYIYIYISRKEGISFIKRELFSYTLCFVKRNHSKLSVSNEANLSHIDQDIAFKTAIGAG